MRSAPGGRRSAAAAALLAAAACALHPSRAEGQVPDVQDFLAAEDGEDREEARRELLEGGFTVDAVYAALRAGLRYGDRVPKGRVEREREADSGLEHRYFYVVPESYDPARAYPVRFYLHGGVNRIRDGRGGGWWSRWEGLAAEDHIAVFPAAWGEATWWTAEQVTNLRGILDALKRQYNVDENRVTLTGVSDGGTGAYYVAVKETTPWAAFFPFIASPGVLLNPRVGAEGLIHVANLVNKPLYIVNGETDRLYPVRAVEPYLESFSQAGVPYEFHPQPGGHDTQFWPELAEDIDTFHGNFPRDPLPDRVLWATEDPGHFPRAHWLVLDEVGHIDGDEDRGHLAGLTENGEAGVVEAVRTDNTVELTVYHVPRLRLLLSPEEFDLSRPVRVVFNGVEVHNEVVEPSLPTLLTWAGRDLDRSMLFVAELEIRAP